MQPVLFNRLSVKLILIISSILLLNLTIYTFYTISQLRKDLTESYTQSAYNISDLIRKSTRYSMLLNRKEDVYQIIRTIGTERGVEKIRIYNKQGNISYSSNLSEVNRLVNTDAEACYVCHSKPELPVNLTMAELTREYITTDGKKVLGLINPIKNEPDCYNADCHAHEKDKKILGVLDVIISTERIDNIIDANIKNVVTNSILLMILIPAFSALFIILIVNRPLKKISKGIDELSKGNLDYKISVTSKDELGSAANEFNQMAGKLDKAYKEIKEWSETLNHKVQEKNEELKKIYEQITQIEKLASLGKLSATVAHELNNPLEGILTYSKLISKKLAKEGTGEFNKDALEYLSLISSESARCGKIVKDLLLFSRKGDGEFERRNIVQIIEASLVLINHHLEIQKIDLMKKFDDYTLEIQCDGQKIEQALLAVLINAIEAMGEGGKLMVSLTKEDNYAVIRIKDDGRGIAEKDLPFIFEPFYSTKGEAKGTGLGLAVAYGIVNQHRGRITVEDTSLKGTTFKLKFPLFDKLNLEDNESKTISAHS